MENVRRSEPPHSKDIQKFIETIPASDRAAAIENARKHQETFTLKLLKREMSHLPAQFVQEHNITEDLDGWEKYLRVAFEKESDFRKRDSFEEWSIKYLGEMAYAISYDQYNIDQGMSNFTRVKNSFFEYLFSGVGRTPELWWGAKEELDDDSLLIHSIDKNGLQRAITSGVVGRDGRAAAAFCQDRVVYDRGYIIAFQANELKAAGYPILQIDEDYRDAKILKEWRSVIPVDLNLARLIVPTTVIPDRSNASKAQIATSYFGEEYLRTIPRFK